MNPPRVLIAGTSSGCGKTSAVCAVLTLLKRRYFGVRACKCGPDYIDPMFHTSVLGIPSTNLDPFFCDGDLLRGHEFHYWDSTENGSDLEAVKPNGKSWLCGVTTSTLYEGYPHLYLRANIQAAEAFYSRCI